MAKPLGVILLFFIMLCAGYLYYHSCLCKPKLLFKLSVEECPEVVFYTNLRWGEPVKQLCREKGIKSKYFFATLETKVTHFQYNKGGYDLEFEKGEKGKIYFYQYHKRFKKYVEIP